MSPSDNVALASRKRSDNWFHNTRVIICLFDSMFSSCFSVNFYSGPYMSGLTAKVTGLLSHDLRVVSRQWGITVIQKKTT